MNDDLDPAQEQLLANAVADYLDLKARGLTANIDNYCARYPQMGTLLRTELETVDQIDRTLADATDVTTNAEELPARLSGHRILGELGSGGMGRVLLAHDEALDRTVAIKVLDRKLNYFFSESFDFAHTSCRENNKLLRK